MLLHGLHAVIIRPMTERDVPHVCALEQETTGAMLSPQLAAWLRLQNHTGLVAQSDAEIIGYLTYRFDIAAWKLIVEQLTVRPDHQRQEVGRQLLARVLEASRSLEGSRTVATVPERCLAGQLFLRNQGFRAVRIDHESDSYLFEYADISDTNIIASEQRQPDVG